MPEKCQSVVEQNGECCCSVTKLCPTVCNPLDPWTKACQAYLFFTISWSFLKLLSIESVMPSNHLILCCPFSSCLQTFPATGIEKSYESALCIRWPEYWSFTFSISPFNECSGLISFRIDWFELLPVQGTLKSVLQHHN